MEMDMFTKTSRNRYVHNLREPPSHQALQTPQRPEIDPLKAATTCKNANSALVTDDGTLPSDKRNSRSFVARIRAWLSHISIHYYIRGWRKGVIAGTVGTSIVLLINVVLLSLALANFDHSTGLGVLYSGDCDSVKTESSVLHVAINVMSTALLGASSYTMQCLSSPTRRDVNRAHDKRKFLNVGVPSLGNLFYINKIRATLWWLLTLSTMPLHLFWNSVIFTTTSANELVYLVVDESFLSNGKLLEPLRFGQTDDDISSSFGSEFSLSPSNVEDIRASYHADNFKRYDVEDCISIYGDQFLTKRRTLLAVTNPIVIRDIAKTSPTSASFDYMERDYSGSRLEVMSQPVENGSSLLGWQAVGVNIYPHWLCAAYINSTQYQLPQHCSAALAKSFLKETGAWQLCPEDDGLMDFPAPCFTINYCLSEEEVPQKCTLQYVPVFLEVVLCCNIIKVLCMLATLKILWRKNESILATVGDAVTSFLEQPDPYTEGMCLVDRSNHDATINLLAWKNMKSPRPLTFTEDTPKKIFNATSPARWFSTMIICGLYLGSGIFLLHASVNSLTEVYSLHEIWNLGMGKPNANAILRPDDWSSDYSEPTDRTDYHDTAALFRNVLISNISQLALSTTYFLYNSLFTAQCGALEWSRHAKKYQSLRVTVPIGEQQSSWFLHLPFNYGAPLTIAMTILHFLISQSIFLIRIQWYTLDGSLDPYAYLSNVSYSPIAILYSVCLGGAIILVQVLHAMRPLDASIPIHGNRSMIISAACHPQIGGRDESETSNDPSGDTIAARLLKWGVIPQQARLDQDGTGIGHCSLSAGPVHQPVPGRKYA